MSKGHTHPISTMPGKQSGSPAQSGTPSPNSTPGAGGQPPTNSPPVAGGPSSPNPPPNPLPTGWQVVAILLLVASVAMGVSGFALSQWWFIGSFSALAVFVVLAYWIKLGWSGLPEYKGPPGDYQREKTAWDWAQIVIIPLVILLVGSLIASSQQAISDNTLKMQHMNDVQMAQDQLNESELSSYLANMAGLLQQPNAHLDNQAGIDIRNIARADTLTVLEELVTDSQLNKNPKTATTQPNSERKKRVLRFLYQSGLINRDPNSPPFVNLAGADFSYADLRSAELNGADLAGAIFSHADMSNAFLNSADLSQATLDDAHLNGAQMTYAPITDASLVHTDLSGADLSGADLTGSNLSNAVFTKKTDVTGTTPPTPQGFTNAQAVATTAPWKLIQTDTIATIAFNEGNSLPAYAILDLSNSELQLLYGPYSKEGAAVVLLPALYSQEDCPNDYCETAPVTITSTQIVLDASGEGSDMDIGLSGTIAGLPVTVMLQFLPPAAGQDSITVNVSVSTSGVSTMSLDAGHQIDAFKPVILKAMDLSPGQFTAQQAFINSDPHVLFPLSAEGTAMYVHTFEGKEAQRFGLSIDTKPGSIINYPTITVSMFTPTSLLMTAEELPPLPAGAFNNLSLWGIFTGTQNTWPDTWSYTVVASNPYHIASQT
jgi:uncharacterized protein YjbI with pentapeptide repeats